VSRRLIDPARTFNLCCAVVAACGGVAVLYLTAPLLFDWRRAEMVLIMLPSVHAGFAPWVKVIAFAGLVIGSVAALAWGIRCAFRPLSSSTTTANIIAVTSAVIFLACAEIVGRLAIDLDLPPLNSPDYYANPHCGDDNFKLRFGQDIPMVPDNVYHPMLGWTGARSPGSPDGRTWPSRFDERPKILFYGDSFMRGMGGPELSIPALVESRHKVRQAVNFGVAGYGVDQIWLRYRTSGERFATATPVIFGALTVDLDRSTMRYRGALKPVFKPKGETFELVGVPTPRDLSVWLHDNPPTVRSYGLALLGSAKELLVTGVDRSEVDCNRAATKAVNLFVLEKTRLQAESLGHRLIWVLFVPTASFYKPVDWRHAFLSQYFASTNLPWIDGREIIRREASRLGVSPEEFFNSTDGHLNARGNEAMASGINKVLGR
jgi:hypothetical protein